MKMKYMPIYLLSEYALGLYLIALRPFIELGVLIVVVVVVVLMFPF